MLRRSSCEKPNAVLVVAKPTQDRRFPDLSVQARHGLRCLPGRQTPTPEVHQSAGTVHDRSLGVGLRYWAFRRRVGHNNMFALSEEPATPKSALVAPMRTTVPPDLAQLLRCSKYLTLHTARSFFDNNEFGLRPRWSAQQLRNGCMESRKNQMKRKGRRPNNRVAGRLTSFQTVADCGTTRSH